MSNTSNTEPRVRRLRPLEYLPPIEEDERVGDDFTHIEEDEVVKDSDLFEPIPPDVVIGWASPVLEDHSDNYFLLDCPDCHATFSSKLSFCPGCGLMVFSELRSRPKS